MKFLKEKFILRNGLDNVGSGGGADSIKDRVKAGLNEKNFTDPLLKDAKIRLKELTDKKKGEGLNYSDNDERDLLVSYVQKATLATTTAIKGVKKLKESTDENKELNKHVDFLIEYREALDKTLNDGKIDHGILFFKKGEYQAIWGDGLKKLEDAVLYYTGPRSRGLGNIKLRGELTTTFLVLANAKVTYEHTIKVKGDISAYGEHRVDHVFGKIEELQVMAGLYEIVNSSEVREADEFIGKFENTDPAGLLTMYQNLEKDDPKRLTVLSVLDTKFLKPNNIIIIKNDNNKYEAKTVGEETDDSTEVIAQINPTINDYKSSDVEALMLKKTLVNVGVGAELNMSYRTIVDGILAKYIPGFKYVDIFDETKKAELITKINAEIKGGSEDITKLNDLTTLKSIVENPENYKKESLADMNLLRVLDSSINIDGKDLNISDSFAKGTGVSDIIKEMMKTNNGLTGSIVILTTLFGLLFSKKNRGKIFGGILALTAITAGEETMHKYGGTDAIREMLDSVSPKFGKMYDKIANKLSSPEYKIKHLGSDQESTYRELYKNNKKKLEEEKHDEALDEEDFAQVYGQLYTNIAFRNKSISEIGQGVSSSENYGVEKYKDLVVTHKDGKQLTMGRTISSDKVNLVIKALLEKWDTSGDVKGADLFISGGAEESVDMDMGIDGASNISKQISESYTTMSFDNPHKERVGNILGLGATWSFTNASWMLGKAVEVAKDSFNSNSFENIFSKIGDETSKKELISTMIGELEKLSLPDSDTKSKEEIDNIIKLLETLKTRETFNDKLEEFTTKVTDKTDGGFGGLEKYAKAGANVGFAGISALARLAGVNNSFEIEGFDEVSVDKIDEAITEGNALLTEQKELVFGLVKNLLIIDSDGKKHEVSGIYNITTGKFNFGASISDIKEIYTGTINSKGEQLDFSEKELSEMVFSGLSDIPLQTKETSEIVGNLAMLYKVKAAKQEQASEGSGKGTTLDLLKINSREVLQELDDMTSSMVGLGTSNKDSLGEYFSSLRKNTNNIAQLQEYKKALERVITTNEPLLETINATVEELLKNFEIISTNINNYLEEKNTKIIALKTVGESIDKLKAQYILYNKLQKEFIDDGYATNLQNWGKNIFGDKFEQTETNQVLILGQLITALDSDKNLDSYDDEIKSNLGDAKKALDKQLGKLIDGKITELAPTYSHADNTDFINGIKEIRDATSGIVTLTVKKQIEKKIENYIESMIDTLLVSGANITEISDDFNSVKREVGSGEWSIMGEDWENRFEEIGKQMLAEEGMEKIMKNLDGLSMAKIKILHPEIHKKIVNFITTNNIEDIIINSDGTIDGKGLNDTIIKDIPLLPSNNDTNTEDIPLLPSNNDTIIKDIPLLPSNNDTNTVYDIIGLNLTQEAAVNLKSEVETMLIGDIKDRVLLNVESFIKYFIK